MKKNLIKPKMHTILYFLKDLQKLLDKEKSYDENRAQKHAVDVQLQLCCRDAMY